MAFKGRPVIRHPRIRPVPKVRGRGPGLRPPSAKTKRIMRKRSTAIRARHPKWTATRMQRRRQTMRTNTLRRRGSRW